MGRLWYIRLKGCFYPLGPIEASSAKSARRKANKMGFKPIAEVWETTRQDMEFIQKERRRQIEEFRAAGRGTEALMMADT
mgnify:CR=1 FL=1